MTNPPFDPFDDPLFQAEMEKTPAGRAELMRWRAGKRKQELNQLLTEAKAQKLSGPEAERQRKWIADQEKQLKELDRIERGSRRSETPPDRMPGSNIVRGFISGTGKGLTGAADLLLAPADILGSDLAAQARDKIAQTNAALDEGFDARGLTGGTAEFAGALASGLYPYGKAAQVSGRAIAAGADALGAKGLAEAVRLGQGAASPLKRAATNFLTGLPLSGASQVAMPTDASAQDRLKDFALNSLADLGFGALIRGRGPDIPQRPKTSVAMPGAPDAPRPDAPQGTQVPVIDPAEVLRKNQEAAQKRVVDEAAKAAEKSQRKIYNAKTTLDAQIEYSTTHKADIQAGAKPGWNKLTPAEQQKWIKNFRERNSFEEWLKSQPEETQPAAPAQPPVSGATVTPDGASSTPATAVPKFVEPTDAEVEADLAAREARSKAADEQFEALTSGPSTDPRHPKNAPAGASITFKGKTFVKLADPDPQTQGRWQQLDGDAFILDGDISTAQQRGQMGQVELPGDKTGNVPEVQSLISELDAGTGQALNAPPKLDPIEERLAALKAKVAAQPEFQGPVTIMDYVDLQNQGGGSGLPDAPRPVHEGEVSSSAIFAQSMRSKGGLEGLRTLARRVLQTAYMNGASREDIDALIDQAVNDPRRAFDLYDSGASPYRKIPSLPGSGNGASLWAAIREIRERVVNGLHEDPTPFMQSLRDWHIVKPASAADAADAAAKSANVKVVQGAMDAADDALVGATPAPVKLTVDEQMNQPGSVRGWWNSLKPTEKEAALLAAGQETGTKGVRGDMRYDALSEKGKMAVETAYHNRNAPPVETPQPVANTNLDTSPTPPVEAPKATRAQLLDAGYREHEIDGGRVSHEAALSGQYVGAGAQLFPGDAEYLARAKDSHKRIMGWASKALGAVDSAPASKTTFSSREVDTILGASDYPGMSREQLRSTINSRLRDAENWVAQAERVHELWKKANGVTDAPAVRAEVPEAPVAQAVDETPSVEADAIGWWVGMSRSDRAKAMWPFLRVEREANAMAGRNWAQLSEDSRKLVMTAFNKAKEAGAVPVEAPVPKTARRKSSKIPQTVEDLSTLSTEELGKLNAKVYSALDALDRTDPQHAALSQYASTIEAEIRSRGDFPTSDASRATAAEKRSNPVSLAEKRKNKTVKVTTADAVGEAPAAEAPQFVPDRARARKPAQLTAEELPQYVEEYSRRMAQSTTPIMREENSRILEKLVAEQRERALGNGLKVESAKEVGAFALGSTYSYLSGDENDPDRAAKAFIAGLAAAGGTYGLRKVFEKKPRPVGNGVTSKVVNMKELEPEIHSTGPLNKLYRHLRNFYGGTVRSTIWAEAALDEVRPYDPNGVRNANTRMNLMGTYIASTEKWLTDRPVIADVDGEPKYLLKGPEAGPEAGQPVWSVKQILDYAGGTKEEFDALRTALTSDELAAKRGLDVPMDTFERNTIIGRATPEMLYAAKQMRYYELALLDVLVDAGRIKPELRQAMGQEEWYSPLWRILEGGGTKDMRNLRDDRVSAPNPLKQRQGGSELRVVSPTDVTIMNTAKVLRTLEYSRVIQSFVDVARSIGDPEVQKLFMRRVKTPADGLALVKQKEKQAAALAQHYGVDASEFHDLLTYTDPEHPAQMGGFVTHWENGSLHTYKVNQNLFTSIKAMLPVERELVTQVLAGPMLAVTKGVVNSPTFVFNQLFIDSFAAATMSRYGFKPVFSSVRGWWHIVSQSPQYRRMLDIGGPGTIQSMKYVANTDVLRSIQEEGGNALVTAWKQMREMRPIEAYKTLALPLAEAARVGEYLKALDHGETTLDAVYAAWNITGNTRLQGASRMMRTLNQLVPFQRASLSAIDELWYRTGTHAFRPYPGQKGIVGDFGSKRDAWNFFANGVTKVLIPTMAIWWANKDDEEIAALRRTTAGQRYWFIRPSNWGLEDTNIYRIPGAHVIKQVFGSSVELALDKMQQDRPDVTKAWFESTGNSLMWNMIPTMGAVPLGLVTNHYYGRGGSIDSQYDEGLDPWARGYDKASYPARVVGKAAESITDGGISPNKIDYVINSLTGTLGQDLVAATGALMEWHKSGYVPAKQELPVIKNYLRSYPGSGSVEDVERFYDVATKLENVAHTIEMLEQKNPSALQEYITANKDEVAMAKDFIRARMEIADLRRAASSIKSLGREATTPEKERDIQKQFMLAIVGIAGANMQRWDAVQKRRALMEQ